MRFEAAPKAQLLAAVKANRSRKEARVVSYLERCAAETFRSPKEAVDLCLEAPEFVRRCKSVLGVRYPDYLVRAYGIAGTALELCGSYAMAQAAFRAGAEVAGATDLERAGLTTRRAMLEAALGRYSDAIEWIAETMPVFEAQDPNTVRDDLNPARPLVLRAIITGYMIISGIEPLDVTPDEVFRGFQLGLRLAPAGCRRTRESAIHGICHMAASLWFGGYPASGITPAMILGTANELRERLRKEGTPYLSSIDAKVRWTLGLATFRLFGGLSRGAERHFREGRKVLSIAGTKKDVAEITLDLQWCLLADGRWAAALAECQVLQETIGEEGAILMWANALKGRFIPAEVLSNVYSKWRGLRRVAMPVVEDPDAGPIGF